MPPARGAALAVRQDANLSHHRAISDNHNSMETEVIIKFGKLQHMKELIDDGLVFMNTLEFYRTLERDDERKDPNEGAQRLRNLLGGTLRMQIPGTRVF